MIPILLPLLIIVGLTAVGFFVTLFTLLQTSVEDMYRGRIFGAFNTVQALTMLVGMWLAGSLRSGGDHPSDPVRCWL